VLRFTGSTTVLLLAVVLVIGVMAIGCAPPEEEVEEPEEPEPDPEEEPREPTELKIGYEADATNLDPRMATDLSSGMINELLYEGLVMWDEDMAIQPWVAEDYELTEDTFTFYLREGVKFHDGEQLTSEDVKYTFDTMMDPEFGARDQVLYEPIDDIEIVDSHTIKFHLKEPVAPLIYYMNVGIVPKHIAEEKGDEYLQTNPVGCGPFKFVNWEPGDQIEMEAFDDYWDGRPGIDLVTFRVIPEEVTRRVEVETGGIHIAFPVPAVDVQAMRELPDVQLQEIPGASVQYISFNHEGPPFDDKMVRQAMAHAIDREEIIDHVFHGLYEPAYTQIIPQSWAHNPDVPRFEHNPDRARELLAEAGYEDGFAAELKISDTDPRRAISEILQYELAEFGVDLDVIVQEWGAFYEDILEMDFCMYILTWVSQTDPDTHLYRQFHSANVPPEGANRQRFSNERVDELLVSARTTMDQDRRKEMYLEIQEILAEEQSYVHLNYTVDFCLVRPEVQNYQHQTYYRLFQLRNASLKSE